MDSSTAQVLYVRLIRYISKIKKVLLDKLNLSVEDLILSKNNEINDFFNRYTKIGLEQDLECQRINFGNSNDKPEIEIVFFSKKI